MTYNEWMQWIPTEIKRTREKIQMLDMEEKVQEFKLRTKLYFSKKNIKQL